MWYSLDKINETGATYRFLLGGRGLGKTYAVIKQAIEHFFETGEPFVYVRRYKESISPTKVNFLLSPHYELIEKLSEGQYNHIKVWQGCFWLEYRDEEGNLVKKNPNPIGFLEALNTQDTSKGQDKGFVKYIIFDEVIGRTGYLKDEFAIFTNLISSLVRHRPGTIIYLLANPISKFCLYFDELGIPFNEVEQGKIYIIVLNKEAGLKCAFEYIADSGAGSSAVKDEYFAFENNQKAKSITSGEWEFLQYPHLESGIYKAAQHKKEIYIEFAEKIFCCEVCKYNNVYFLFFRPSNQIPEGSYYLTLNRPLNKKGIVASNNIHPIVKLMNDIYKTGKVFYSSNQVGDYIDGFRRAARELRV